MITKLVKVDAERPDLNVLREAADILRNGGLVAFPTETVYGLGANGLDAEACKKIYEAKGRPSDNPLILTIGDLNGLYPIVNKVTENAEKIIKAFYYFGSSQSGLCTRYRYGRSGHCGNKISFSCGCKRAY